MSGAVVPGAKIEVTNQDTNLTQAAVSDSAGQYRLLSLPTGRYRLEASAQGFQRFIVTDVILTVNEQRAVDVMFQVGSISQQVEVTANALQVETASTQLGAVIDEKKIISLPLNGRSYIDLLGLQAGVAPGGGGSGSVSGSLSAGNVSVNGQRGTSNSFLVNGGDVSEGRNFGTAVIPNLDAVAEFRLITNSFDAEFGRFSGSVMNAITKSGNNGFHGSLFEYVRNDKLDARGFFDPTKAALKRNQFGYAIGGPLLKNRLFWFTDYQGTREVVGASTGNITLPSLKQRQGDFTASNVFVDSSKKPTTVNGAYWASLLSGRLGYTVTEGMPYYTANCTTTSVCVFPGAIIPERAFSPAAKGTVGFIPAPNQGENTFASASEKRRVQDDKMGQRIDIVNKTTGNWFAYYHWDDSTVYNPLGASLPGWPNTSLRRSQQAVLGNTFAFSPTMVNDFRMSYMRVASRNNNPEKDIGIPVDKFGFKRGVGTLGIINSGLDGSEGMPRLGFQTFSIGNAVSKNIQVNNTYALNDSLSIIRGPHTLKLGGEARYLQINGRNQYAPNGTYSFDGSATGSDFADYLLGFATGYTQASMQLLDSRSKSGGIFAQDSWRLRSNLTLNYGVRWEAHTPWYDIYDRIQNISPGQQSTMFPTAPKGWVFPGDEGIPRTLAPTTYNNFAPRVGLAYSPRWSDGLLGKIFGGPGKTSIRTGFGMFWQAIEDSTLFIEIGDAPFGLYWVNIAPVVLEEPFRTAASGVSQTQRFPFVMPRPGDPALKTLDFSPFLPITSSNGYAKTNRLPYANHYNFTIQREITKSTMLTVAYVGTQSHRLLASLEANPGDPDLCLSLRGSGVKAGTPQCGRNGENNIYTRPDGTLVYGTRSPLGYAFGWNPYSITMGNSAYNSGQLTLERRASDLTLLAAYTFSKALDNSSAFGDWINYTSYRKSRSLSSFDSRHNFVFSYVYRFPFDRLAPALPKRLTQGWDVSGVTRFANGFPITLGQSGDWSLRGSSGSTEQPDLTGKPIVTQDPRLAGPDGRANRYFMTDAFQTSQLGQFGNANRRFFSGPGFNNWDISVHKVTTVREKMTLEFRGEYFNAFNHSQFNNPNGTFGSSNFGRITSARAPRIGQMSLRFAW